MIKKKKTRRVVWTTKGEALKQKKKLDWLNIPTMLVKVDGGWEIKVRRY